MKQLLLLLLCASQGFNAMDSSSSSDTESHRELMPLANSSDSIARSLIEHQKQHFQSLKKLSDIPNADWKNCTNTLDFTNKELSTVEDFADYCERIVDQPPLFPFKTITKIILAHNALKEIKGTWFSPCEDLRYLDVSHNQIPHIDLGELFDTCQRLKYIDASYNGDQHGKFTVTWGKHRAWVPMFSESDFGKFEYNLPIIKLIGNNIQRADQEWLQERYQQEVIKFGKIGGGLIGGIGGGIFPLSFTVIYGLLTHSPWFSVAHPLGCLIGGVIGSGVSYYCNKNYKQEHGIPLYFEDKNENESPDDVYKEMTLHPLHCLYALPCTRYL